MQINTKVMGTTPETELRKLEVITTTDEIVVSFCVNSFL